MAGRGDCAVPHVPPSQPNAFAGRREARAGLDGVRGQRRISPRGLTSSWRTDLAGRTLDVQYLRADRPLARTRAVVLSLLGLVDKSDVFDALEVQSVVISSDGGPLPTAHDGEVDDPTESMAFALSPKRLVAYH